MIAGGHDVALLRLDVGRSLLGLSRHGGDHLVQLAGLTITSQPPVAPLLQPGRDRAQVGLVSVSVSVSVSKIDIVAAERFSQPGERLGVLRLAAGDVGLASCHLIGGLGELELGRDRSLVGVGQLGVRTIGCLARGLDLVVHPFARRDRGGMCRVLLGRLVTQAGESAAQCLAGVVTARRC